MTRIKTIIKTLIRKAYSFQRRLLMRRRFLLEAYYGAQSPRNGPVRRLLFLFAAQFLCMVGLYDKSPAWHSDFRKWTAKPLVSAPESGERKVKPYTQFCKLMLNYDVISFDVFDTLLLRPFDNPKALFYLLGQQHRCPSFRKFRELAERDARRVAFEQNGNYEVTLREIYERLQRYVLLDIDKAMALEIETEIELAFANPYMKTVFAQAQNLGKRVIAVSDMYLPREAIVRMLEKCGYAGFEEIFVSNEHGISKRGGLFDIVRAQIGDVRYLHIGDNHEADYAAPKRHGFDAEHYKGVNRSGNAHRAHGLTELVGSAYRGVVNAKLHSGAARFNQYYEYGYTYAGFLALGYCHFIHDRAKATGVDKLLFLSRDGYLLKQVYDMLYPGENTAYVYWSRNAGLQLAPGRYNNEFFLRYVKQKIKHELTLAQVFKYMELEHLCEKLAGTITPETILTNENYGDVVEFLRANWSDVLAAYKPRQAAAKAYYAEVLCGCKKACAVDVGWAATGYTALRWLIEEEWALGCELTGLVAGTNNLGNRDVLEAQLIDGTMDSYMFSPRVNTHHFRYHQVNKLYGVFIEMMLSAPSPSFKGFLPDGHGGYKLEFDLPEAEGYHMMRKIEQGALDFARDYSAAFEKFPFMMNIPGGDVYLACCHVCYHVDFFRNLFGTYPVQRAVGHASPEMMTLNQLIDREFQW